MTPIKVDGPKGTFTVHGPYDPETTLRWHVQDSDGVVRGRTVRRVIWDPVIGWDECDVADFATRTMALVHAADLAGIERQRVAAKPGFWRTQKASGLGMYADFGRFNGIPPSPGLMDIAHCHARERYAALGGAA